jgi:hypothetical protein
VGGEKATLSLKVMIFGGILIILSIGLYSLGSSVTNPASNPKDPLFGSYLVVFSVFLGIAGFLVLVSQVFRGKSLVY